MSYLAVTLSLFDHLGTVYTNVIMTFCAAFLQSFAEKLSFLAWNTEHIIYVIWVLCMFDLCCIYDYSVHC